MTFLELEKICKKRRMFKYVLFFLVIIILTAIFGLYFYSKKGENRQTYKIQKKINESPKKIVKKEDVKKEVKKVEKIETFSLTLDLDNINIKEKPKIKQKKEENKSVKTKVITSQTLPSYKTCIKIAKNYYKKRDYKNALIWAKNANIQNNKDPESWIISSRALYKLGKKEKAVKILKIYYKYTKNEKILNILKELSE